MQSPLPLWRAKDAKLLMPRSWKSHITFPGLQGPLQNWHSHKHSSRVFLSTNKPTLISKNTACWLLKCSKYQLNLPYENQTLFGLISLMYPHLCSLRKWVGHFQNNTFISVSFFYWIPHKTREREREGREERRGGGRGREKEGRKDGRGGRKLNKTIFYIDLVSIFLFFLQLQIPDRTKGLRLRNLPTEVGKVANLYSKNKYLL